MSSVLRESELDLLAMLHTVTGYGERDLLTDFLELVANQYLIELKADRYLQYGNKDGQSLYTHVLDGIFLLHQLACMFDLPEHEIRTLLTAFTVHDINKLVAESAGFNKDATINQVSYQIKRFGLDIFFAEYEQYLEDITTLVRGHGGHSAVHGEALIVRNTSRYTLGQERVLNLLQLIRAVDVVDLSHTLDEQVHKTSFLSHLNTFALSHGVQYSLYTHRLDESRGALTNVLHNAISETLHSRYGLIPLLMYPDGIAYLVQRGHEPYVGSETLNAIAIRTAQEMNKLTSDEFKQFIEVRPLGIKVDPKCLSLGKGFDAIWDVIYEIVQRRSFKHDELAQKAITRARSNLAKNKTQFPAVLDRVEHLLANNPIAESDAQLRIGELIRSYVIFLSDHYAKVIPQPWERVYALFDLSEELRQILAYFDARLDRAYVFVREMPLTEEMVYTRLLEDGRPLLESQLSDDQRIPMFMTYLGRHAAFGSQDRPISMVHGAEQYVTNQHKQCIQCNEPFLTRPWMSADVRSDISVQSFSNRLRGGPGEPKKQICQMCQTQYLLEKLSYPEIMKEDTVYLHLYPYAFFTRPFITGLQKVMGELKREDGRALWLDGDLAIRRYTSEQRVTAPMLRETRAGKPHSFGIYVPKYAEALIGNLLIFPLNPAGANSTERFLFALEYALIFQRYFGCRVVLSSSAVVPFNQEHVGDITTDMTPLSCRGLITLTSYQQFPSVGQGNLALLWEQIQHLYVLKRSIGGMNDPLPLLVQALAFHPLGIFYAAEKQIEARGRDSHSEWAIIALSHTVFAAVEQLARSKGAEYMAQLSTHMRQLTQIAWKQRLIGKTLAKHSLMVALDEVLRKIAQRSKAVEDDLDALKAATVQDIFAYLERVSDGKFPVGTTKWNAIKEFVDLFYTGVYAGVYGNSPSRLLNDEKLLRSTYMFYIREQIPRKVADAATKTPDSTIPDSEDTVHSTDEV